jgi:hypothetical protein
MASIENHAVSSFGHGQWTSLNFKSEKLNPCLDDSRARSECDQFSKKQRAGTILEQK